jgi:hypothetical protein
MRTELRKTGDVISQEELREIAELQMVAWRSTMIVMDAISAIKRRIDAGAAVEPGELGYSEEVRAVLSADGSTLPIRMGERAIPSHPFQVILKAVGVAVCLLPMVFEYYGFISDVLAPLSM